MRLAFTILISQEKKKKNIKTCITNFVLGKEEMTFEITGVGIWNDQWNDATVFETDWSVLVLTLSLAQPLAIFTAIVVAVSLSIFGPVTPLLSDDPPPRVVLYTPARDDLPNLRKTKTRVEKRRSKSRVCILFNLHFCCGQYSETHLEIYLCVMCMHIFSNNHCIPTSHHNPNSCVSFLVSNVLVLFIEIVLECLAYSRKFLEFSVVMMKIQRLLLFLYLFLIFCIWSPGSYIFDEG